MGNNEPTSDGPHVPGSSAAFPELTGAASGQSAGEHLPGPGLLSPNTDIPLAQKNRLAEELRPEPKSPNISARAKSSSVDQSNSGISFTGNPQMPSTRPHRRITPPEQSADYYNVRKVTPPSASLKCSQQPAYDDQYHKPTPPTSFPSNNLYGPRTQSSRSSNPLLTVNRPNAPTQTFRPSNPDPKGYYGMPVNPAQFAPNAVTVRPNRAPNRTPPVLSDPSYSQNPRTLPTQGSAAYGGGIPRASLGDTPRMMSPRQARNRYEATYYNQPGKWPYQMMPGNHPKKLPDNPPVFPTGFVPPPRMATAHYAAYPSRANLSPHGQRSILPSDMRHYSDLPDGNLIPEDDSSPVMSTRCVSQSSIAAHCCTPHPDGLETASVMSFASGASTHQDLDSKVDQLRNLLSVIDSQDAKEIAQTLFSLSNSKENCQAMRQSGCIPLLVKLQHKEKSKDSRVGHYIRMRAAHTMRNIITAGAEDRRGRRELRVLRLLEIVRGYCVEMRFRKISNKEKNVEQALAAIMKLSFEEEHRAALGELGGVEAIGEFLQVRYATKEQDSDSPGSSLLKYASMTLTNMTFGNTRNKALLGNSPGIVKAFLGHLKVINDEDLIQVSASVLRNLSCKADERSKTVFQECNAVAALMTAAQKVSDESALRTILYAVWNLSAHSSENKTQICETPGALAFLVKMLVYKNVNNSLSVVESSGGILRNLSSHVAVKPEYRTILREHECFQKLLVHLRSPSLRVVSNACGTLWNLSARCQEDQELLWKLGAVSLLKPLVSSKNKSIAKGAGAAIKNLHNFKSSTAMSPSQSQNLSSNSRKQNGVGPNTGSPSQTRAKENRLGRSCSRSRDIQSLDSITGSTDDMAKESGRRTVKLNNKSISGQRNGDAEPTSDRVKGVRWVDDRTSGKRAGKDPIRKVTGNEIKRAEGSPDEQQLFTSGGDSRVPASKDLGAREDISNLTTAVAQTSLGEKNRGSRKSDRLYSPKTKKKSSWKNKKHALEPGNTDINLLISLQDSEPHKPTNASTTKQGSANLRRKVYSDSQRLDGTEKASSRCGGKQISVKTEEDNLGREEHENRGDTVMDHSEETEVPQSETSEEDGLRSSATSGKSNVKNARVKTMDDNSEEKALVLSKKMGNLSIQRCQCPEETEVWIKRTKRCDRCQRRRVSHSSESTSGSGRSSYESLSSSNRQLNRKELGTNGPGYVTTI